MALLIDGHGELPITKAPSSLVMRSPTARRRLTLQIAVQATTTTAPLERQPLPNHSENFVPKKLLQRDDFGERALA